MRPYGAMVLQARGVAAADEGPVVVLPPRQQGGSRGGLQASGVCGGGRDQFCRKDWDRAWEAEYGAVPRAPPNVTDIIEPQAPNMDKTVCGNTCSGPADCGLDLKGGSEYACSCAIPTVEDARKLGLDPVALVAVCVALFASEVSGGVVGKGLGGKRGLDGRGGGENAAEEMVTRKGERGFVDERGVGYTCRCNATFTDDRCCGSRDGRVWLP